MRFGVHFSGCGVAALYCLSSTYRILVKEPPKMVLRRMMGPSLETGSVFDAVLSVNYCANCDSVSVRAVREKCDEKGLGAASGRRNVRCRQSAGPPFGSPPRLRSGLRQNRAGFLEKREKGRTPGCFTPTIQEIRVTLRALIGPTRQSQTVSSTCKRFYFTPKS